MEVRAQPLEGVSMALRFREVEGTVVGMFVVLGISLLKDAGAGLWNASYQLPALKCTPVPW